MIVDFHTHVFPPSVIGAREETCRRGAAFRAMYRDPRAKLATARTGAGVCRFTP